jgi:hypothetical protein
MGRLLSKAGLVVSVVSVLAMMVAPNANASGAGAAVGTGTIFPPPTTAPQNITVTFGGTAVGLVTDPAAGYCNVSFTGGGTGETIVAGNGGGSLNCNGGAGVPNPINVECTVSYSRAGTVVAFGGSCGSEGLLHAVCVFEPTSQPPATFDLQCTFELLPV